MKRAVAGLVAVFVVSGCKFDDSTPAGKTFRCPDGKCPSGLMCQPVPQLCVTPQDFDGTPPGIQQVYSTVYAAPPGVDTAVTRLGLEGSADVSFDTTERVASVQLSPLQPSSAPPLDCSLSQSGGQQTFHFTCRVVPGSGPFSGGVQLTAALVDLVGNTASVTLVDPSHDVLFVDTVPPLAPDVEKPAAIVYRRVPWGADSTDGGQSFSVSGANGSMEPGIAVLARVAGETVGRAQSDDTGAFGPIAFAFDPPGLALMAVDEAGNRSPEVTVHDVAWVATLGGKQPGSDAENPHHAEGVAVFGPPLVRTDGIELGAEELGRNDGQRATIAAGWSWENPDTEAPSRPVASWAYDRVRARLVVFGFNWFDSINNSLAANDQVTEWNHVAERWVTPVDPEGDGDPPVLWGSAMAYDSERRNCVSFGGRLFQAPVPGPANDDTWLWNGVSWRLALPAHRPPASANPLMADDPARGRVVLVESSSAADAGPSSDTWEWDGLDWSDRGVTAGLGPGPLAFWPGKGLLLVETSTGKLWLDGTSGWTVLAPPGPSGATLAAVDEVRGRLVVAATGGTFEWDGNAWAGPIATQTPAAPFYFDPVVGEVVAGEPDSAAQLARQRWDGARWVALPLQQATLDYTEVALAYSSAHDGVIGFGGATNGAPRAETFWWNGTWHTLTATGAPAARTGAGLGEDPFTGKMVLVGGYDSQSLCVSDAWELQADAGWTSITGPDLVYGCSYVLAPTANGLLAARNPGFSTFESFLRDPTGQWNDLQLPSQSVLLVPAVASLPDGGALLVDWEPQPVPQWHGYFLSGTGWVSDFDPPLDPTQSFSAPALVFDQSRGRLVMMGAPARTDLLERTDTGWRRARLSDPEGDGDPGQLTGPVAAHHPGLHRTLVLDPTQGEWLLRSADTQPAVVLRFSLAPVGGLDSATFSGVELNLVAGAESDVDGGLAAGARVLVWRDGAWTDPGVSNAAGSGAPQALQASETDPLRLTELLAHQRELGVAVVPLGQTGRADTQVSVDYAELVLHYRLP